jgi:hypothetical protein
MFRKKRKKSWFISTLPHLAAVSLFYKLARGFQKLAQKQGKIKPPPKNKK